MTVLNDNMSGWFKRRRGAAKDSTEGATGETPENGETASSTASTTTGGSSSQEPVVVWEAANQMEAQVVKGRLESEGIPAFVRSEALGIIYGLTAGGLARADVLVPGPLAERAMEILFADELSDEQADDPVDDQARDQARQQTDE
jgi:hypothetical protein